MTKESILGRLLIEGNITLAELIILAESPGKTLYIDLSVLPEEDQYWRSSFNITPYHTSPNIVSSKL